MLMEKYFKAIEDLMARIRDTQTENIQKAGHMIAESVAKGGAVHIYDTGHIINHELIERAGGLMLYKPLRFGLNIENPVRPRDKGNFNRSMEGLAEYVLRASNILPGDVLIMGSVSGKSLQAVDLAIKAKEFGVKVIVITSLSYSTAVESEHSSGKRLFELGDIVLDNCAPVGDAMIEVDGLEAKICPASGLSAAYIMWAITAVAIEALLEKGITPSVFKSHNFPGGPEYNLKLRQIYSEKGY